MSVIPVIEIALNQSYEEDDSINSSSIYSKNYWALLLLILCILVVFGNVLVILSVAKERSLQNITNFFIVSLAIADLCVAGVVMPFYAYTLANWGDWNLPDQVCDFYLAMDVVCSTSSIFNLVAISFDRFFAVTSPIMYSQHRHNHTPAYVIILLCWSTSLAIGLPIMFGLNHRPSHDSPVLIEGNHSLPSNLSFANSSVSAIESPEPLICAFYNPDFIIYSSLGSFYIPCFIMIVLYSKIFKTLHLRAQQSRAKRPPPPSLKFIPSATAIAPAILCHKERKLSKQMEINLNGTDKNEADCLNCNETSNGGDQSQRKVCSKCSQSFIQGVKMCSKVDKNVSTRDEAELKILTKSNIPVVKSKKKKKKKKVKDKCSQKKERKATQTLAIVLASFLVCWVPFFTCNILDALSIKYNLNTSPGNIAFQATTLLGYINSCVNPIIYTIFNPEFRKAFKRVLGLGH